MKKVPKYKCVKNDANFICRYSKRTGNCCINQRKAEQCIGILFYFSNSFYLSLLNHSLFLIHSCLINKIAGTDTLGKTVNNLAHMRGLVIFALDDATAVEMKSVMDALVALVIFTSATF